MSLVLTPWDWAALCGHFMLLSLLSVGGAISTVPEMQRFLVADKAWMTDGQFASSIAIAQAAPGPNVLFVALMGWNVGLNAGGLSLAVLGVLLALGGILLPSTTLTFLVTRWLHHNRELRAVRAFKQGMAPIVVALLIATGWLLGSPPPRSLQQWPLWLLTLCATILVWRTKLHLLWLLGAGALLGALGLV